MRRRSPLRVLVALGVTAWGGAPGATAASAQDGTTSPAAMATDGSTSPAPLATDPSQDLPGAAAPVVVGSKPFAESLVLGEIFAQLLEARGLAVDRRPGLGATEIAFQALRNDRIHVYPEYTGTGLLVLLGEGDPGTPAQVFDRVSRAFRERWGIRWLPPLGFENTYAIAVREATADSLGLETLSDLARESGRLTAGFTPDFLGRSDGLEGLRRVYGVDFRSRQPLMQAVKYQALAEGAVDVIDGYSTDGALDRYALVVLEDDRGFFPPYEAAALLSPATARSRPGVVAALTELSGRISAATMRRANRRAEVNGDPVEAVARDVLLELGLVAREGADPASVEDGVAGGPRAATGSGAEARTGLWAFLWDRRHQLPPLVVRHLVLVGVSLLAAILLAVPLGMALAGRPGWAEPVTRGVGVLQTIPSIALLAFMIPLLGIGVVPAVTALFLYSLLPVLRNTLAGIQEADPAAAEAGRALGMTPRQVLLQVRLPLAVPVIMAGIRTAAVINVGTATLAAFIGAGGLGEPIVSGLALSDTRLILSGAIPAALLAIAVDGVLGWAQGRVAPQGLRSEAG